MIKSVVILRLNSFVTKERYLEDYLCIMHEKSDEIFCSWQS